MIKTFIFGTPHGFDLYEKSVEYLDYFKGFYISSRRGRRMMVNRKSNGETTYNYLRYGLQEVGGRPNSFFGMTVLIDNNQYCPNLKVMLEWFDYLFDKLVKEHQLFKKNDDGVLHYQVSKFEERSGDVEWLKSNLPNILTQAEQTQLMDYDSGFVDGKAGQVITFKHDVNEARLLNAFKKSRWVSVSSQIIDGDDNIVEIEEIELDFHELDKKLNEFNQVLLPIAVAPSKGSLSVLQEMNNEVHDIASSISKFQQGLSDIDQADLFLGLRKKYDALQQNIATLLAKIKPEPETQFCFSCKQTKPVTEFRSKEATKCIACEQKQPETQFCFSCKQTKPVTEFRSKEATKCNACEQKQAETRYCISCKQNKPATEFRSKEAKKCIACEQKQPPAHKTCTVCGKKKPLDQFDGPKSKVCKDCDTPHPTPKPPLPMKLIGTVLGVVLLGAAIFGIVKNKNTSDKPTTTITDQPTAAVSNAIDKVTLEKFLTDKDFKGVYNYIKDKDKADVSPYTVILKDAIERYLWGILDSGENNTSEIRKQKLQTFYSENYDLLELIGFGQEDQNYWNQFEKDYSSLRAIAANKVLTENERNKGNEIIHKYSAFIPSSWSETLSEIPNAATPTTQSVTNTATHTKKEEKDKATTKVTPNVNYTKVNGERGNKSFNKNAGINAKPGTKATITKADGTSLTVNVDDVKSPINCGDNIQLTITVIGQQ